MSTFVLRSIGVVRSELAGRESAPLQGDEGAPEAWIDLDDDLAPGLRGLAVGDTLIVLTWLHLADRSVLEVHPRGRVDLPLAGVFATRSPDRPNPVGLHRVRLLELAGRSLRVGPLEAIDGTPVVDLKPALR